MKRILKLVKYPNEKLKTKCYPVRDEANWDEVRTIADRMHLTMRVFKGIGLSAPQIGLKLQIFVMNMTGIEKDLQVVINPKILSKRGKISCKEGCLSFPGIEIVVERSETIEVEYQNEWNEKIKRELNGIEAVCFQHEFDHLNGELFIDKVSSLKKKIALKKFKKLGHL